MLRERNPKVLDKLIAVRGDVEALGVGLSADSLELLKDVSIIFHSAASVRFDDQLQYAILLNTRGTREVVEFATKLKNLAVFCHISTTYCYPDRHEIEEKVSVSMHEVKLLTTKIHSTGPPGQRRMARGDQSCRESAHSHVGMSNAALHRVQSQRVHLLEVTGRADLQ